MIQLFLIVQAFAAVHNCSEDKLEEFYQVLSEILKDSRYLRKVGDFNVIFEKKVLRESAIYNHEIDSEIRENKLSSCLQKRMDLIT